MWTEFEKELGQEAQDFENHVKEVKCCLVGMGSHGSILYRPATGLMANSHDDYHLYRFMEVREVTSFLFTYSFLTPDLCPSL